MHSSIISLLPRFHWLLIAAIARRRAEIKLPQSPRLECVAQAYMYSIHTDIVLYIYVCQRLCVKFSMQQQQQQHHLAVECGNLPKFFNFCPTILLKLAHNHRDCALFKLTYELACV